LQYNSGLNARVNLNNKGIAQDGHEGAQLHTPYQLNFVVPIYAAAPTSCFPPYLVVVFCAALRINGAATHGAWCMVHGAWCMMHGAWCIVHGAWCTRTHGPQHMVPGAINAVP
jgi:hypothetical protein